MTTWKTPKNLLTWRMILDSEAEQHVFQRQRVEKDFCKATSAQKVPMQNSGMQNSGMEAFCRKVTDITSSLSYFKWLMVTDEVTDVTSSPKPWYLQAYYNTTNYSSICFCADTPSLSFCHWREEVRYFVEVLAYQHKMSTACLSTKL